MFYKNIHVYFFVDKYNLSNMVTVKSYNYSKLLLGYGPERGATVTVQWNTTDKAFRLVFGCSSTTLNAHSIMREQLQAHLNEHLNLAQIVQLLHETYEPLVSISKLPTLPQLCVHNSVSAIYIIQVLFQEFWCLIYFILFF